MARSALDGDANAREEVTLRMRAEVALVVNDARAPSISK
jgi:hypothetical protein